MPRQTRTRVYKPQHEKSKSELGAQERKRANGLIGKAHQLFVDCNAKVALVVQYPRTGRTISYFSDKGWSSMFGLEVCQILATATLCLRIEDASA